jgi:hypothetical protein
MAVVDQEKESKHSAASRGLYVYEKDGRYLKWSQKLTHVGPRDVLQWVRSIHEATPLAHLPQGLSARVGQVKAIPVEVEVRVTPVEREDAERQA